MAAKKTKAALTKERILQAALDVIDREGLEALTMRRLGAELDVEAMSLYYHVPNKAALLEGVSGLVLSRVEISDDPSADWREVLLGGFRSLWRVLRAHPNALPLLYTSPDPGQVHLQRAETVLGLLGKAGFGPADAHRLFRILQAFVFGHATMAGVRPQAADIRALAEDLAERDEFAQVRAALADPANLDPDEDFEIGIRLLLDGIGLGATAED